MLLFAFGLLLVSFRSIVIAFKAILLNLLSVAAAYGVLVAVFQWGWGEGLFDFESNGGIANWLPMFMFVILFGLSMDYHVFILSRIREALRPRAQDRHGDRLRHQVNGGHCHQRGVRDGRCLLGLHDAPARRPQGDGRRPGGRRPDRRHDRPRSAPPGDDDAPRREELVLAEVARVASNSSTASLSNGSTRLRRSSPRPETEHHTT